MYSGARIVQSRPPEWDAPVIGLLAEFDHQAAGLGILNGGGYGYPSLSQQTAGLERGAKAKALDDCVKSFDELKALCARVVIRVDQ